MIQRALATLLCLMGAAAIALGIASATAWRADDVLVADAQAAPGTTMVVTDPGVLDLAADSVTVTANSDAEVVIALGRAEDVDAWVGGDAHTRVTGLAKWHVLATDDVEAEPEPEPTAEPTAEPTPADGATAAPDAAATPAPTETPADPADGAPAEGTDPEATDDDTATSDEPVETTAPDPSGSDLWVGEVSGRGEAELEWTAQDGRWSVLVASVGDDAGPPAVSLAWPQVVTTPWLWPGVIVGSLLVLGGLAWWTLLLLAGRRGTRRATAAPVVPVAVPEPVGATAGSAGSPAPLTRRQLRELEEQQRTRGARASRSGVAEHFPVLIPGPQRDVGPGAKQPEPPVAGAAPHDVAGQPAGRRSRREAAHSAAVPPSTTSADTSAPQEARDRRFGFRARRRADEAHTPMPAQAAPVAPPAVEPAVPAATQWTPVASADAWRRAWGLPASGDQSAQPGPPAQAGQAVPPGQPAQPGRPLQTGPVAPPTTPDQPGEPPLRRRRDNR